MSSLVDHTGAPLTRQTERREMKSGQIKKTPYGDVLFKLVVDIPRGLSEQEFAGLMYEYGNIISEAYAKKR